MKIVVAIFSTMFVTLFALGQSNPPIRLWTNDAPGALGQTTNDIPTLTPFFADPTNATGAAMVVLPGGGYGHLADHEGRDYALWLAGHGISSFVLKYRLGSSGYRHPVMLEDAARALRLVRANAKEWKLDPKRIGIIGSSAGGHLAATLMTHFDSGKAEAEDPVERQSSRPDLGILCYPVITMGKGTHQGSHDYLLGTNASPELELQLSADQQVTGKTPPCFIFSTAEDKAVPAVWNSLAFAAALGRAGVPFDLHIYEHGRHGIGLGGKYDSGKLHPWTADCLYWLKQHSFVN
jgi:acetyl esterase/lipase